MKFCCGVTLYYPSKEELDSISIYKEVFDRVYVFDNTDSIDRVGNEKYFFENDGFEYISKNENLGLSVAYNVMCKKAISSRFDYICLFDQDSTIFTKDLIEMIDYIQADATKDVAVYVPEIVYQGKMYDKQDEKSCNREVEIEWAISSGSFIKLSVYQETLGFDENYFIDRLDYDYCFMTRNFGYKVIMVKNVYLYQKLGEQSEGIVKNVSQHGALRHYYMFRNRLYFYLRKNKPSIHKVIKVGLLSLRHFTTILFFEKNKFKKLMMMIKGLIDFNNNKMGKYKSD